MAPDLNSLPASPRLDRASQPPSQPTSTTASRRTSQIMGPPSVPASATTMTLRSPSTQPRGSAISSNDPNSVPLRHPRPLTAAELCLECEKEQEAVVNRLTRELTALRAQTASVASNASVSSNSTSASLLPVDITDPNPTHQIIGATHPTPSRRHRSSSASTRSLPNASISASTLSTAHAVTVPIGGVSQASADRAAAAGGSTLGRQNSTSVSGTSTPARQSLDIPRQTNSNPATHAALPQRPSISRDLSQTTSSTSSSHATAGTPLPHSLPSPALSPIQTAGGGVSIAPTQHLVDVAAYRNEMELVKAENEALRQRVRALERALRARRRDSSQSDASTRPDILSHGSTRQQRESSESGLGRIPVNVTVNLASPAPSPHGIAAWAAANNGGVGGVAGPRERSESQSTTASSRRGVIGVPDDDVRVGESASSMALGRGA